MERKVLTRSIAGACALLAVSLVATGAPGNGSGFGPADGERNGPGRQGVARALQQLDVDGDGQLSLGEFVDARLARAERRFESADDDGDGFIAPGEPGPDDRPDPPSDEDREAFRACVAETLGVELPAPQTPTERFDAVDTDDDGLISLDEALAAAETKAVDRFDALDGDDDGYVSRDELATSFRNAARLREARRACREEQQSISDFLDS